LPESTTDFAPASPSACNACYCQTRS
jgi:hypothetical protein